MSVASHSYVSLISFWHVFKFVTPSMWHFGYHMITWKNKAPCFLSILDNFWIAMIIDSHRANFQSGVRILLYTNLGSQAFYFIQNNQGFYRIHQTHLHILNVAMVPKTFSWSWLCWNFVRLPDCWLQTVFSWPSLFCAERIKGGRLLKI